MTRKTLVFKYLLFAILAISANLITQRVVLSYGMGSEQLALGIIAGTLVGLIVKYILDKHWIFYDHRTGISQQGCQFIGYIAMSIITTLIFWATEISFWLIWQTNHMREIGAISGLTIGYMIKYHLDARFVFCCDHRRYAHAR